MLTLAHDIPGRLRLTAPLLKAGNPNAQALLARLRTLPGVMRVQLRPRTGSLIVRYDPASLRTREAILHALPVSERRPPEPGLAILEAVTEAALHNLLLRTAQAIAAAVI